VYHLLAKSSLFKNISSDTIKFTCETLTASRGGAPQGGAVKRSIVLTKASATWVIEALGSDDHHSVDSSGDTGLCHLHRHLLQPAELTCRQHRHPLSRRRLLSAHCLPLLRWMLQHLQTKKTRAIRSCKAGHLA
jgi:hypothetical protein